MKTIQENSTPPGFSIDNQAFQSASSYDEALFELWEQNLQEGYAPIDAVTGLPLPIAPADTPHNVSSEKLFNDNHHVWYWRTHENLADDAGKVVRHSRLIRGPRWAHERYHSAFRNGMAWMPEVRDAKFYIGVMACSGIIPEYGVDVTGREPRIVKLGQKAIEYLQSPKVVFPERRINRATHHDDYLKRRGVFFMQYALQSDFDMADIELLERFTEAKNESIRRSLGMQVIHAYVKHATTPLVAPYIGAKDKGLLPPMQPKTPAKLVNEVTSGHWVHYLDTVTERAEACLAAA